MPSIYRKYRPKNFAEMVGQKHIKLTLQSELESDKIAQAYLFCGPRGLGKTTAARLFAKALNCTSRKKGEAEPCNQCESCRAMMEQRALDLIEIDAASHTGVDNVRENIIESVRFAPYSSKYKVFIIDEVHMLSLSAFNALLKTLEEPPAHAVFILCTTEIHKVPETIISRCQRFDFRKVPNAETVKRLKMISREEQVGIEDKVFELVARKSEGCMRDAESILGQILALGDKKIGRDQVELILPTAEDELILEFLAKLAQGQVAEGLEMANRLVEDGVDLEVFNRGLIDFLRRMMLVKAGVLKSELADFTESGEKQVRRLLERLKITTMNNWLGILIRVQAELKNSLIAQLPLEMAVVEICSPEEIKLPGAGSGGSGHKMPIKRNPALERENKAPTGALAQERRQTGAAGKPGESAAEANFDLAEIKNKWGQIVKAAQAESRDLLFINANSVWPVEFDGRGLLIGFKYDLHKSRFDKNSNREHFETVLGAVIGQKIKVRAKTLKPSEFVEFEMAEEDKRRSNEKMSGVKVSEDNILESVLESFGGEVVE